MFVSDALSIFSQIINFTIFVYLVVILLKLNALDVFGLLISAFGLLASLITSVVSVAERRKRFGV